MRHDKIYMTPGEWYPLSTPQQIVCCDCGLVHDFEIKGHKGAYFMRIWKNPYETTVTRLSDKFDMVRRKTVK